jgi:Na+-driven multidrug efflux pump
VDRIVTFALLAYGLVNVISSVPAFLDYGAYAETLLSMLGVDVQITDPAAGKAWGIAAVLVLAVGWCATAVVSWWSVRRGRLTWWIPLVGGILFTFVSGALMAVPLMNDPAVWQALVESAGG